MSLEQDILKELLRLAERAGGSGDLVCPFCHDSALGKKKGNELANYASSSCVRQQLENHAWFCPGKAAYPVKDAAVLATKPKAAPRKAAVKAKAGAPAKGASRKEKKAKRDDDDSDESEIALCELLMDSIGGIKSVKNLSALQMVCAERAHFLSTGGGSGSGSSPSGSSPSGPGSGPGKKRRRD
jgi:hypothetical protein